MSLNVDTVLSNQNIPRQTIGSQATVNSLKINVTETQNAKKKFSINLFSTQLKKKRKKKKKQKKKKKKEKK